MIAFLGKKGKFWGFVDKTSFVVASLGYSFSEAWKSLNPPAGGSARPPKF
jgi:hypothetical protein